jgi:hypothetical protein
MADSGRKRPTTFSGCRPFDVCRVSETRIPNLKYVMTCRRWVGPQRRGGLERSDAKACSIGVNFTCAFLSLPHPLTKGVKAFTT